MQYSDTPTDLPFYKSHKVVQAAEIVSHTPTSVLVRLDSGEKRRYQVDPKIIEAHEPVFGDVLIFYPDGYRSISPKAAFEEGYTIHDGP